MHKIQQFILTQLTEHHSRRYSDMRPVSMEPSQFMYHLKQLIGAGMVTKTGMGTYALTAKGKQYADRAHDDLSLRHQPRVGAMVICHHSDYGLLCMRRNTQPAHGFTGFPIVDIPIDFEPSLVEFVTAAFTAQTGVKSALNHRAEGYINLYNDGELEGSLLAHVMVGEYQSGTVKNLDAAVDYLWETDEAFQADEVLASSRYITQQLTGNDSFFFFFEYAYDLKTGAERHSEHI